MKILKKAKQKNVELDKDYYTIKDINEMLDSREICYFDTHINECHNHINYVDIFDEPIFRIFTENLKEIKVILDGGYYHTVAIGKNDKIYHVVL